jgi:hypothetical protein
MNTAMAVGSATSTASGATRTTTPTSIARRVRE